MNNVNMQFVVDTILDTISGDDPALRAHIMCGMPVYWQFANGLTCDPRLRHTYVLQQAITTAQAWTRSMVDRAQSDGRAESGSEFDAGAQSQALSQSQSSTTGLSESYSNSDREWSRRSRDDASSFSGAFDGSNSSSRQDGYDRSTRSSQLVVRSVDSTVGGEKGLSKTRENTENDSENSLFTDVRRTTATYNQGTPFGVPPGPGPIVRHWAGFLDYGVVGYSDGSVQHTHHIARHSNGTGKRTATITRFVGSETESTTRGTHTTEGRSSDRRNVHRDGEAHARQSGGLAAGSSSSGESHARNRSAAIREAHSRQESEAEMRAQATAHSESAGTNFAQARERSSDVRYSQLYESLTVMAAHVRELISEIERDLAQAFSTMSVGRLKANLPSSRCPDPRGWRAATRAASPCATPWPASCGEYETRWTAGLARLLTVR